jgi:hypothetical protein
MAVKNYAWYSILHPIPTSYDLDNSTFYQVYDPYVSYNGSDTAIDYLSTQGWYQTSNIFLSQYVAGVMGDPIGCYNTSTHVWTSDCMTQWGSKYWADQGKDYKWILNNYYGPSATGGATLTYFT